MLSKKAKYGIRALLYLAERRGKGPIQIKDIAADERIPKKFLEAILVELKTSGILRSRSGKKGGYEMLLLPKNVNLGQIVRNLDGPLALISCVSQTAYAPCDDCPDEKICIIRKVMKDVRDSTAAILEAADLETLLQERVKASKQGMALHFDI
jgi:Rrf2 family protein